MEHVNHPHASTSPSPIAEHPRVSPTTYHAEVEELVMEVDDVVNAMRADPEEHLAADAANLVRALALMKSPSNDPLGLTNYELSSSFLRIPVYQCLTVSISVSTVHV